MHELALTDGVVQTVLERMGQRRIVRVRLAIGRLMAVVPESLRFCFDVCTRGTALEGATLEINEVPARARCRDCGLEDDLEDSVPLCRCGSADIDLLSGRELQIQEVEVA